MIPTEYLKELLIQQKPDQALIGLLQNERDIVDRIIRKKTKITDIYIFSAGSYAKGTIIAESFDLDIAVYFPSYVTTPLNEIYDRVKQILKDSGYNPQPKNVALRCYRTFPNNVYPNFHIDVVPGKAIKPNFLYAYLYQRKGDKRIRTSVMTHVQAVKATRRRDILKLLKLWKVRQNIDVPTFILEILFLKFMKTKLSRKNLSLNDLLQEIYTYIANTIMTIKLVDPANAQNVISKDIPKSTKRHLKQKAEEAKQARYWNEVFRD